MADKDHDDRRHRQREHHTDKARQLRAGHQRKDHRHRVQADAIADQYGRQHHALQQLPDSENQADVKQRQPLVKLQPRGDQGSADTHDKAEIGNDAGQTGDKPQQQGQFDTDDPQAQRVQQAQGAHHHELTAQKGPDHLVGLARHPRRAALPVARQQVQGFPGDVVPVAHQVKRHHGRQRHIGQPAQQPESRTGDAPDRVGRHPAQGLPVVHQFGGPVDGRQIGARDRCPGLQPGQRHIAQPRIQQGNAPDQAVELLHQQRHGEDQRKHVEAAEDREYQHHAEGASAAARLDAIH